MQTPKRVSTWLIGGASAWLVYAITLSALHIWVQRQLGVPFSIQIYTLNSSQPLTLFHILLVGMIAPGLFLLDSLSFLHIHIPWVDAAMYNWGKLTLLSSLPALLIGAFLTSRDSRLKLAGAILGLLLVGGSLLHVLNILLTQ